MFVDTDNKLIWKNGSFEKWNDSNVHILSHTLHYGTGVFEGVRAYQAKDKSAIFRLDDHTKRLFNAASKISIKIPFSQEELNRAQCETLIKKNSIKFNKYLLLIDKKVPRKEINKLKKSFKNKILQ